MKTTMDLPDELVRQLKLRAAHDGRKLKDLTADFLTQCLMTPSVQNQEDQPVVSKDKKTGLPVIVCKRSAPKGEGLTPRRVAEILNGQEAEWTL